MDSGGPTLAAFLFAAALGLGCSAVVAELVQVLSLVWFELLATAQLGTVSRLLNQAPGLPPEANEIANNRATTAST